MTKRKLSVLARSYIRRERKRRIWHRVVVCLASVVVFCTVYALILPAITMEDQSQFPTLTTDSAYVSGIAITGYVTGTEDFDAPEKAGIPGNDTTPDDRIVRTFDDITYYFSIDMAAYDSSERYGEARVKMEFVLPLSAEEAMFDQTAMAWMDTAKGYEPTLTVERRSVNGADVECQVLTCYKHLLPAEGNQSVIPGDFTQNVTIKVLSMKHGDKVTPTFCAAMEQSAWDGPCENHPQTQEKKTITAETVTVTAAPKYNVQMACTTMDQTTVDFSQGNDRAANKNLSPESDNKMAGRMNCLSVTLQLYNDDASKGLKGIELPTGEIVFDIDMEAAYHVKKGDDLEEIPVTDTFTPRLWSYGGNDSGFEQEDGRSVAGMSSVGYAVRAPYNKGEGKNACYQGGTWRAEQEGNQIHVVVSGFEINPDSFPENDAAYATAQYPANVGCFSAGEFWILQPFNEVNSKTNISYDATRGYDIQQEYGIEGTISLEITDHSMHAVSVSDQVFQDTKGTNDSQMNQADDTCVESNHLTIEGTLANRIFYSFYTNIWGTNQEAERTTWECGLDSSEFRISQERFKDGRDAISVGEQLSLVSGFYHEAHNEEQNRTVCATTLMKFDAEAITPEKSSAELPPEYPTLAYVHADKQNKSYGFVCQARYATKKDGQNWLSDAELLATDEAGLIFYDKVEKIPEGQKCVAVLFIYTAGAENNYMSKTVGAEMVSSSLTAVVNRDPSLIGNVYMLTETTRLWEKKDYDSAGKDYSEMPYDWTGSSIEPDEGLRGSVQKHPYRKEEYFSEGGAKGSHVGGCEWGDSLLITGYETRITKNLAQKTGENEKETYQLDADQRVVDFVLHPGFRPGSNSTQPTTIYIEDTLPKYLRFRPGSCYFGGTYEQTSENGGTQGKIQGGRQIAPTKVVDNEDGTQTLLWRIEDVTVGQEMSAIYYSAAIGSKGMEEEDVPMGTTELLNKVRIWGDYDLREPTKENVNYAEAGIAVVRGAASSFGKYVKRDVVEPDGQIEYVIYRENNGNTPTKVAMVDTMPYNGDSQGSHYHGTYTVSSWKITDTEKCDISKLQVYYTEDIKYRDKTKDEISEDEIKGTGIAKGEASDGDIIEGENSGSAGNEAEGWKKAAIDENGVVTAMNGRTPVAWAILGELDGGKSIHVELQIQLKPEATADGSWNSGRYINTLSNDSTVTTTEAHSVRRTLEGLTWLDKNYNGIQDAGELAEPGMLDGVKVSLWKLKDSEELSHLPDPSKEEDYEPYHYQGNMTLPQVVIKTGQVVSVQAADGNAAAVYTDESGNKRPGRYKFTDLPDGIFAVKFEDGIEGGTGMISHFIASPNNCGDDATRDSDGKPIYAQGRSRLERTVILGIEMPEAKDMNVVLYESKHNDSGFYERGCKLPDSGGSGTWPYRVGGAVLSGAVVLHLLSRRRRRTGR